MFVKEKIDCPILDGTVIRDFIHIEALAAAHLFVLGYFEKVGELTHGHK